MWCYTRGQTSQLCRLSVHIWLCLIILSLCRASRHHEREPRLRKVSHWKAILSWISKPVQRIPDDKPFYVVWNAPSFRCGRQYGLTMDLDKFGIIGNEFELFHGEAVNLFYESRLGLYPRYLSDNKPKYDGLPQLANLTAHLEWVKTDLDWYIPNITYNGLAVIDWESWRPIFDRNWKQKYIYPAASYGTVAQQHPAWPRDRIVYEAKLQFETAARAFMEKTLSLCRELRPEAKWGFYLFPDCYNYKAGQENCSWIIKKNNDRLSWLYRSSSALYPSIYLTDVFEPRNQKLHVRGILNEAYRVRKRFTSPYIPVIPYTKYVYTNTDRFYDKESLENTIGEAMDSGAAGVSLWDSYINIQNKKQCKSLHSYLNNVLGPYVKNLLEWSENCSQSLCGGHGRCVSVEYQPRKSTPQRVVIQKGPTIDRVVVSKQSKTISPEKSKTIQPIATTIKMPLTPRSPSKEKQTTVPRNIDNANNEPKDSTIRTILKTIQPIDTTVKMPFAPKSSSKGKQTTVPRNVDKATSDSKASTKRTQSQNWNTSTTTSFFKHIPGLTLHSSPKILSRTTPRTLPITTLNASTKGQSSPASEGAARDKGKVIDFPPLTKDNIKLVYQTPESLPTDPENVSLPGSKTISNKHTTPNCPNNSNSHKVTIQKAGLNLEQTVKQKSSISPGIHSSTPAYNDLPRTQKPIANSTSNDLIIEQISNSDASQKDINHKLILSRQINFPSKMPTAISLGSVDNIEYNNTNNGLIKELDMKMYDNRPKVSLNLSITPTNDLDKGMNTTTHTTRLLFPQSKPPLKFNSSVDFATTVLFPTIKHSHNRKIYQSTSRSIRRKSRKRLSTASTNKISPTTTDPLSRLNGRAFSTTNVTSSRAEDRIKVGNISNATKHPSLSIHFQKADRGEKALFSTASTFLKESHLTTPIKYKLNTDQRTVSDHRTSVKYTTTMKFDVTSTSYRTLSQLTIGPSLEPVDVVLLKNTTKNNTVDHSADDKHPMDEFSFIRMLVQVFIILVVAIRRLFASEDLPTGSFISKPYDGPLLHGIVNQDGGHYTKHFQYEHVSELQSSNLSFQNLHKRLLQRDTVKNSYMASAPRVLEKRSASASGLRNDRVLAMSRKLKNMRIQTSGLADSMQIKNRHTLVNTDSLTFGNQRQQPSDREQINKYESDLDPNQRRQSVENSSKNRHSKHMTKTHNKDEVRHRNLQEYNNYVCRCYSGWTGEFCGIPMRY